MGLLTGIAIYLTIWWTALLVVLQVGNKSYAESGIEVKDGGDPGAPVNPNLKKKFITTTWVSAICWVIVFVVVKYGLITLPEMPDTY